MSDRSIWLKMKSGDRSALQTMYTDHIESLLSYGHRFTKDAALVEDAVQDMFIDLWKRRDRVSETDHILKYLLVALRHRIFRMLKEKSRVATDEIPFRADDSFEAWAEQSSMAEERKERLLKAMQKLSSRQKEAIYMKYQLNLSYEEICEALDINYQSVRNLVSRGLKVLRDNMVLLAVLIYFLLK